MLDLDSYSSYVSDLTAYMVGVLDITNPPLHIFFKFNVDLLVGSSYYGSFEGIQ